MTSSDFNMLRLEAPRELLQITDGTGTDEMAVELANPAPWVRALVRQQRQAEDDLKQLLALCGNTVDHTNERIQAIERAYQTMVDGTRYVYDRVSANEVIAEAWLRTELANAANAYQTFAREVWEAMIERTHEATQQQICQATQLTRINDALALQAEANLARSEHLATFQGNVELWASAHQHKVAALEQELRKAQDQIRRIATQVPVPGTPPHLQQTQWRSPAQLASTSGGPPQTPVRTILRSPSSVVAPQPQRRIRPPAVPYSPLQRLPPATGFTPPLRGPLTGGYMGGFGGGVPPRGPPTIPPRGPPSGQNSPGESPRRPLSPFQPGLPRTPAHRPQGPALTARDLVEWVAEGVTRANQAPSTHRPREAREERIQMSRLKMTNPEPFDGKPATPFNPWWKSVIKYLSFYPETRDAQKIAWVGTLLAGTARTWDLHRYDEMGENDTWEQYAQAIQAEYHDSREAANAQLRLGQLRYAGDIRAYMTEFRALNKYARATGEGLQEKVDLAMTDAILDMRFAHYMNEFADDEGFLQATTQAALQVEKKKALKQAREAMKGGSNPASGGKDQKRENTRKEEGNSGKKINERGSETRKTDSRDTGPGGYGASGKWKTKEAALKGVPPKEHEEYFKSGDNCWRCGRPGHRTYECYAHTTLKGTSLPHAPWTVATVATREGGKRKREDEPATQPAKQQRIAAVETMEVDQSRPLPPWAEDSEGSDF
jgi:hypothetical protein